MHAGLRSLVVPLIALLGGCSDSHDQQFHLADGDVTGTPWVEVTGTGEKSAVPDRFSVQAVARRRGEAIAPLTEAVNAEVDTILNLTRELGIEEKQVTASELRVHPVWEHDPERRISGYRVERPVRIKTRGMDTQAALLTKLAEAGVREIRPLGADIANRAELERQALAQAVTRARSRARALTDAANRDLGPALRIIEEDSHSGPARLEMAQARSDGGSWAPGEVTVTRRVRVRFRLTP